MRIRQQNERSLDLSLIAALFYGVFVLIILPITLQIILLKAKSNRRSEFDKDTDNHVAYLWNNLWNNVIIRIFVKFTASMFSGARFL